MREGQPLAYSCDCLGLWDRLLFFAIDLQVENTMKKHKKTNINRQAARRKILVGAGVLSSLPLTAKWGKPVINSVVLPAHAQTSTTVPPALIESFALSLAAPNGPVSQGADFFARLAGGVFTVEIYTDAQNTDLSPQILRVTIPSVGVFVSGERFGCGNDGSQTGPFPGDARIQIVAYNPGVSIELQYEFDSGTFVLLLNNSAANLSCPVL